MECAAARMFSACTTSIFEYQPDNVITIDGEEGDAKNERRTEEEIAVSRRVVVRLAVREEAGLTRMRVVGS